MVTDLVRYCDITELKPTNFWKHVTDFVCAAPNEIIHVFSESFGNSQRREPTRNDHPSLTFAIGESRSPNPARSSTFSKVVEAKFFHA
jgi:hypothetical protein